LKDDDDTHRQVKSLYCAENKLRGTFDQCSPPVKKKHSMSCLLHANAGLFLPIVEQIHADHVSGAYVLHITMPIELCIRPTYPEMLVFAHTRLAIVSGPLQPCWETTRIDFLYDVHLHPAFLFDRFKCL